MTEQEVVTVQEAMRLVGVTRRTIYNWMAGRKVAWVRTAGGNVRILRASLYRPGSVLPDRPTAVHEEEA